MSGYSRKDNSGVEPLCETSCVSTDIGLKNAIKTSLSARRVCICFERWESASSRFAETHQLVRRKV